MGAVRRNGKRAFDARSAPNFQVSFERYRDGKTAKPEMRNADKREEACVKLCK